MDRGVTGLVVKISTMNESIQLGSFTFGISIIDQCTLYRLIFVSEKQRNPSGEIQVKEKPIKMLFYYKNYHNNRGKTNN